MRKRIIQYALSIQHFKYLKTMGFSSEEAANSFNEMKEKFAYKRRPSKLKYDSRDYQHFILPSTREALVEEFGKPNFWGESFTSSHCEYVKKNMKVDNYLFFILLSAFFFYMIYEYTNAFEIQRYMEIILNSNKVALKKEDFK